MSDNKMSGNESAEQIIQWGKSYWIESCFDRAALLKPCPTGATGACCKICHMGPCRFLQSTEERVERGICGVTLPTVVARNFLRMAASGTAAHTDLARDMAFTLLGVANGEIKGFKITDVKKLLKIAQILEIEFEGKDLNDVARNVAIKLIDDFGRQTGVLSYVKRAPEKTKQRWEKWGIIPKGIDREIAEAIHCTNIGVDNEPDSLLLNSLKVSLADGWGGSMISTDLSDILFGTPQPVMAEAGFGIFKEDEVNLIIVGHDPTLAKKILDVVSKPDMIEYAKSKGAKGINLGEIFIMRHGLSNAGGFTNQELCIMTGIIDAVAVDVQCIMPTLVEVANNFHTKIITTSRKAKLPGALHIEYDTQRSEEVAREIVRHAIDNYPNRTGMGERITEKLPMMAGFSHEYFENTNNSNTKASFRLLNNAIMRGSIRGIVGLVGCDNPRVQATGIHKYLAEELIMDDVLILSAECGSAACAASGYLNPEIAYKKAGPGLKEVYETIGIPPILHIGACVDNSRILTMLSAMAAEGGLSDEIGGMPAVIIAPEWMAEKEIAVGCYFAASGVPVILGGTSPVKASEEVSQIMTEVWLERFKGALYFEPDFEKMLDLTINYIDKAREELNIRKYKFRKVGEKDADIYNEE
jgi:carbon-monoxide dehydrogenase catalytic subunit